METRLCGSSRARWHRRNVERHEVGAEGARDASPDVAVPGADVDHADGVERSATRLRPREVPREAPREACERVGEDTRASAHRRSKRPSSSEPWSIPAIACWTKSMRTIGEATFSLKPPGMRTLRVQTPQLSSVHW